LLILLIDLGVAELNLLILLNDLGVRKIDRLLGDGETLADDKDTLAIELAIALPCFKRRAPFLVWTKR
jgi:hypothetical protein